MRTSFSRNTTVERDEGLASIQDDARTDEQKLWWKVLYQSVVDGGKLDHQNSTKRNNAKAAVKWLLNDQEDFFHVCALADVDSDIFRRASIAWLNERFSVELLDGAIASPRKWGEKHGIKGDLNATSYD